MTPGRCSKLIPLGWFIPWANAGAVLLDSRQRVIPYLTCQESDAQVERQVRERLTRLGVPESDIDNVARIRAHRDEPNDPEHRCACRADDECSAGYIRLMRDKWGCRNVVRLLDALRERSDANGKEAKELARILLAWQTNFVLFARLDTAPAVGDWVTLQLSYDEELSKWEPPWERRKRELKRSDLSCSEARECRKHISRGGPFSEDLDALLPWGLRRCLARRKSVWLRRVGRRGMLNLAWHVAWNQASGLDVATHHVEVLLPPELMTVRIRMLRISGRDRYATRADQVGSRATIVAPRLPAHRCDGHPPMPTLLSLVITQRSPASWLGGAWVAALTGISILVAAVWRLPEVVTHTDAAAAVLVIAPTLVATLLSVRAGSEIAEQLTTTLRRLIAAVGVLAAICAVGLVIQHNSAEPAPLERLLGSAPRATDLTFLSWLWTVAGAVLLYIAGVLCFGARRIWRFIDYGRRQAPRRVGRPCVGEVLSPDGAPRIPPPDRWLAANEGDLVPWGWLYDRPAEWEPSKADGCFWRKTSRKLLVKWVQEIFVGE